MKKFVVLSLIGLFVLAFGTAYAQEKAPVLDFKASGFIDAMFHAAKNVPQALPAHANNFFGPISSYAPGGSAFDRPEAYAWSRGRLRFDAIMGKDMMGTFYFEIDSNQWGERAKASEAQRNYAGHWGVADRAAVEVKNYFITFGMPWIPVPTTIQAGVHPLAVRPGAFLASDGPGVTAAFKIDPATIKLMWFKPYEGLKEAADDSDLYGIEANAKVQTITIGGYGIYINSNTYPSAPDAQSVGKSLTQSAFAPYTGTFTQSRLDYRAQMLWLGLYLDGKLGPLNVNFDFVYDDGKVEDHNAASLVRARDVDYTGWGTIINVGFPWEKFLFGGQFIYGSGSDLKKTNANGLPGTNAVTGAENSKMGTLAIPQGTEGSVGMSLILCGSGVNRMGYGYEPGADNAMARAAYGGLWIAKLYAAMQVSEEFNSRLEAYWVGDTSKNGNTIGNAHKADGTLSDDKKIGIEIDLLNTLMIYKNLSFGFGGGILFAGDAMDYWNATTGCNESPKNPYALYTNLTYSF
jgi:hypothetical protein